MTAAAIPMRRLVGVELRKMTDTRAGFWLMAVTVLLAVGLVAVMLIWAQPEDLTLRQINSSIIGVMALLLPVLGILAVTSEWSQRTALATFTLVPIRERVIGAKLLAAIGLAVAATLIALLPAIVTNAIAPHVTDADGSWSFTLGDFGRGALYQTLSLLAGFAFGLMLMSSAPAIVLAYLLPTAFAIVSEVVPGFRHTADWLDTSPSTTALLDGDMTSELWQQLLTSELLWIALPLAIGLVRLRRRELA